jgi:hypothetical protein
VLAAGLRTADIAGPGESTVSTDAITDAIVEAIGSREAA